MEIEIPGYKVWSCPPPRIFERLSLLKDLSLAKLVSAIDTRQRLFNFLKFPDQSLRLSHLEDPNVRIDFLGSHLWIYWYHDTEPSATDIARFEIISSMLSAPFVIRRMKNRGSDPNTNNIWEGSNSFPEQWLAKEGNLQFQFYKNRGLSPGLFLDQRRNREWIYQNAENKSVLNLFAYSCGFSVAAAAGGATEVCSVDVSSDFLNWGKENFELNNLPSANFEFFKQDSILFLEACLKRQRKFDIIICDPPTFGRHKGGIFKLEKDWKALLQKVANCLQPKGVILFSTNLENWSTAEWETKIKSLNLFKSVKPLTGDLDFEGPNDEPLMKAFSLQ
jgi:23S rRNA (cytosine1962-C5)-methyltransferase